MNLLLGCVGTCFSGGSPSVTLAMPPTTSESGAVCPGGSLVVTSARDGLIPLGVWTHVAVALSASASTVASDCKAFDASTNVQIFVNGVSVGLTRAVAAYTPLASYPDSSAPATATIGAGFAGSILDVAVYISPLSGAQILNHTSAIVPLGVAPSSLLPRYPTCNATMLLAGVLTDAPLVFFPLEGADASMAAVACGYDGVNTSLAVGTLQRPLGVGPSTRALTAPAVAAASRAPRALPPAVLRPVSSLFLSAAETVGGKTVGLTLEALVFNSVYMAGATVLTVDAGAAGTVVLKLGCNASCFAGGSPSVVLSQVGFFFF